MSKIGSTFAFTPANPLRLRMQPWPWLRNGLTDGDVAEAGPARPGDNVAAWAGPVIVRRGVLRRVRFRPLGLLRVRWLGEG